VEDMIADCEIMLQSERR